MSNSFAPPAQGGHRIFGRVSLLVLLAVTGAALTGCSTLSVLAARSTVSAERIEPGGKGLFVVRPSAEDPACEEKLQSPNDAMPVDCDSEFIVGCDGATPDGKPFCALVREKGRVRNSIYPGNRRER